MDMGRLLQNLPVIIAGAAGDTDAVSKTIGAHQAGVKDRQAADDRAIKKEDRATEQAEKQATDAAMRELLASKDLQKMDAPTVVSIFQRHGVPPDKALATVKNFFAFRTSMLDRAKKVTDMEKAGKISKAKQSLTAGMPRKREPGAAPPTADEMNQFVGKARTEMTGLGEDADKFLESLGLNKDKFSLPMEGEQGTMYAQTEHYPWNAPEGAIPGTVKTDPLSSLIAANNRMQTQGQRDADRQARADEKDAEKNARQAEKDAATKQKEARSQVMGLVPAEAKGIASELAVEIAGRNDNLTSAQSANNAARAVMMIGEADKDNLKQVAQDLKALGLANTTILRLLEQNFKTPRKDSTSWLGLGPAAGRSAPSSRGAAGIPALEGAAGGSAQPPGMSDGGGGQVLVYDPTTHTFQPEGQR